MNHAKDKTLRYTCFIQNKNKKQIKFNTLIKKDKLIAKANQNK